MSITVLSREDDCTEFDFNELTPEEKENLYYTDHIGRLRSAAGEFREGVTYFLLFADSNGNVNCYDCIECTNCRNCYRCTGCENCDTCYGCIGCTDCRRCTRCDRCHESVNCYRCNDCYNCGDCTYCSLCTDAAGLDNDTNLVKHTD